MDDEVSSQGVGLEADGGAGSDSIAVDAVIASTLDGGGGGRDVLLGGENSDTLSDGDPSGATDGDLLDGRQGGDTVSYAQRTPPVNVDLADDGPDGEAGEADELRSIESAEGGAGADVLSGTDDSNSLDGGAGEDRLTSGAGGDFLHGGDGEDVLRAGRGYDTVDGDAGNDRLFGERGNDVLLPRSRGDDAVSCGSGADIAAGPRRGDRLAAELRGAALLLRRGGPRPGRDVRLPDPGEPGLGRVARGVPVVRGPGRRVARHHGDGPSARGILRGRLLGRGEISRRTGRRRADESGPGRLASRYGSPASVAVSPRVPPARGSWPPCRSAGATSPRSRGRSGCRCRTSPRRSKPPRAPAHAQLGRLAEDEAARCGRTRNRAAALGAVRGAARLRFGLSRARCIPMHTCGPWANATL